MFETVASPSATIRLRGASNQAPLPEGVATEPRYADDLIVNLAKLPVDEPMFLVIPFASIAKKPVFAALGATAVDATEAAPKPWLLTAYTLKLAALAVIAGTKALVAVPSTVVVQVPLPPSTTYFTISVLPLDVGADQLTVNPPSAGTAVTFWGAPGTE